MLSTEPRLVACPRCKKRTVWSSENPFRPFCSERCKLLDLGAWATEQYRIPAESAARDDSADRKD